MGQRSRLRGTRSVALVCTLAGAAGALLITGLANSIAQSGSGSGKTSVQDDAESGSLLYVQNAGSGSLIGGHLTLQDVDPNALYFSDRPRRIAGVLTVPEMLRSLGFGKKGEPDPNAVLQVETAAGTDALPVELLRPRYEGTQNQLSFAVHRLKAALTTSLTPFRAKLDRFGDRLDGTMPQHFGRASLFIDDGGNDCEFDLKNNLTVPLSLFGTGHNTRDSWETHPPSTIPPGQTAFWDDEGGFARGCSADVTYQTPEGQNINLDATDPYSGSNSASCTTTTGAAVCSLDSNYSRHGDTLEGQAAACLPGGPCDLPPQHPSGGANLG
jgi:hypothetical protein